MRMVGRVKTPPECFYAKRRGCTCFIPRTEYGRNGRRLAKRAAKMKEKASWQREALIGRRRASRLS